MMSRSAVPVERHRRVLQLSAAACVALLSGHARADAVDRLELTWSAPPGCPNAQAVRARVRKLAGEAVAEGAALQASAAITHAPGARWHMKLIVHAGELVGERELDARACEDLVGAAAVYLVLLLRTTPSTDTLNEEASSQRPSPSTKLAASNSPTNGESIAPVHPKDAPAASNGRASTDSTLPSSASMPSSDAEPRRWRGLVRLPLLAASIGPLPRPSWGVALAAGVQLEDWRFFLDGGAWLGQTWAVVNAPDVSVNIIRVDVGARACHIVSSGRLELGPCARVSLEQVWARGEGAHVAARTAHATWIGLSLGVDARVHLSEAFSLVGGIDVQGQTSRPRITINGLGGVGQLNPFALTFLVGGEWIL